MCDLGSVALLARATADSQLEARGKPRWCFQPARSCRRDSRAELLQSPREGKFSWRRASKTPLPFAHPRKKSLSSNQPPASQRGTETLNR